MSINNTGFFNLGDMFVAEAELLGVIVSEQTPKKGNG